MEKRRFLEAGKIVNTHGIRGEVKIQHWCDSPEFLCSFERLYINETPFNVLSARVHKGMVLALFEGINTVNMAMALKNSIVCIDREDVELEEGAYFVADIIGLPVFDEASGRIIGTLREVLDYPASRIFVVAGETEHLIPDVPEFIKKVDVEGGQITVHLIEGM